MKDRSARRAALLAQVAEDRRRIAESLVPLAVPIAYAERGWSVVQWVRARPWLVLGATALGTVASLGGKRRLPGRLLKTGLGLWQAGRWMLRALKAGGRRKPEAT